MEMTLRHDAMAEGLEDVRRMLVQLARQHARHLPGWTWDELEAETWYWFTVAWGTYDGRVKLSTWVWIKVWRGLQRSVRAHRRAMARAHAVLAADGEGASAALALAPSRHRWSLRGFLCDLSDDAREAVRVLLELDDRHPGERVTKAALVQGLRAGGWSRSRIACVCREIREALS